MPNPLYDALIAPHAGSPAPFLTDPDRGLNWSYDDLRAQAARLAGVFDALGLQPGDRVLVQCPKSAEALALYVACVMTGTVLLPLNTAYTPAEVAFFCGDAEPALIVCDGARLSEMRAIAGATPVHTLEADGTGSLADAAATMPDRFAPVDRAPGDIAALLYTSGTTGRSKGAMQTHDNLLSNAQTLRQTWAFTAQDVLLHALPIFHTHGLFVATNTVLAAGASMIFHARFETGAILRDLPRATTMMGVPTFYTRLLGQSGFTADRVAHMRLFISGSAPLLAATHVEFETQTGHRILERYGMTETGMITSNTIAGPRTAGSVGPALEGVEVRVTDRESGAPVPKGEIGVVEVRGPNVFAGYWRMPEKTAAEFRDDGFFVTGDLGHLDATGALTIIGRDKDLVITGGLNVYPKELELILDQMPGVGESAVIGIPDDDFGEAIVAVLAKAPGGSGTPDVEAIRTALAGRLARFKQPRFYVVLDALPRNTMGKVQKAALRADFAALTDDRL